MAVRNGLVIVFVVTGCTALVSAPARASPYDGTCGTPRDGGLTRDDQFETNGPWRFTMSYETARRIALRVGPSEFQPPDSHPRAQDVPCNVAASVADAGASAWTAWRGNSGWITAGWVGYAAGPSYGRFHCTGFTRNAGGATETCIHRADRHAGQIKVRFVVKPNPYWPYTPASGPPARFVFSVATGLKAAPIGSPTATYGKLFKTARRLANLGGKTTCFSLAYAVSAEAKRSQRPDLLLACGDRRYITEAHFRSSAFCSTNRTCVGTAGSLRGFVRELGPRAYLRLYDECGTRTCSVVTASYGRIRLALRSANCPRVRTLREIAPRCVASEVLIYRSP